MKYTKSKKITLKSHAELNEKWLQTQIEESPEILGLGENIEVKDVERRQSSGGRLDLLLKDPEAERRYTVELQLGKCDPDHIIRTIEYWDLERKRYPQYEHVAVIVAEDITSRFWNILNLFYKIPLIAIQLDVRQVEDALTLNFIKVLDKTETELPEDEEDSQIVTDRAYWEKKSTPEVLTHVDFIKKSLNKFFPDMELNYNKHYIGLQKNGVADNAVLFKPYKQYFDLRVRKTKVSEEIINKVSEEGLNIDWWKDRPHYHHYKIRIYNRATLEEKLPLIEELFKEAYSYQEPLSDVA